MKENETKTQKKGTGVLKKIVNAIINVMIVLVLIVSILIAVMSLTSKANDGMSVIFGYTVENILTDSMKGGSEDFDGGDFAAGDVIIGKYTNYIFEYEYNVGDIVTFREDLDGDEKKENVCHRIIEVADYQGTRCYRTKGDNGTVSDQYEGNYSTYLTASDIGSVFYAKDFEGKPYEGKIIRGFGNVLTFLQTKFGFFICVLLPMIIFFMYELIRVIFNAAYYRQAKEKEQSGDNDEKPADNDETAKMTPEQMEQFKQFLEFQKQKAESESKPDDDIPEE